MAQRLIEECEQLRVERLAVLRKHRLHRSEESGVFCVGQSEDFVLARFELREYRFVLSCREALMPGAEWLELICRHIPDRYEHLVRYFGWYSNRARGERAKRSKEASTEVPDGATTEPIAEYAARARAAWARLIRKVYEADPLECPKCQGPMRAIALARRCHRCGAGEDPLSRCARARRRGGHRAPASRHSAGSTSMAAGAGSRPRSRMKVEGSPTRGAAMEISDLLHDLGVSPAAAQGGERTVRTPIDGSPLAQVRDTPPDEARAAVGAARQAFLGWRSVPAPKRGLWLCNPV